jgi:disulfide bond formation protein DsbB
MAVIDWVLPPTQAGRAVLILIAALAILAAVWILQGLGYAPCELCLTERYAFYAAAPLAALTAFAASRSSHAAARALFVLLALVFLANVGLAVYHVGVEQRWWPGPSACTGALNAAVDVNDLLKQLNSTRVVNCDEVQLRILGLSLAGWDAVASAVLAIYAALAARLGR